MIPKSFHFLHGFSPEPQEFHYFNYLAVLSAIKINKPDVTYLHYGRAPTGPWWDKACQLPTVKPHLIEIPKVIFGRPLVHFAHQADVARLQILQVEGGIYLDIDTLCVKPLDKLLNNNCVLGLQASHTRPNTFQGFCNAVIISEPGGAFVRNWLNAYKTFKSKGRDKFWDEHSVVLPMRLWRYPEMKKHVTLLSSRAFFHPLWTQMAVLFEQTDLTPFAGSYVVHLWETLTMGRWLSQINENWVQNSQCAYAQLARKVLQEPT